MAASNGRGIGKMGDIRRPSPFSFFLQLYRGEGVFQAMVDFAVLGGLTIAFLDPQLLLHPFSGASSAPSQQIAASKPPPASVTPPSLAPSTAPSQAPAATPGVAAPSPGGVATSSSISDSRKAVANLMKLPPWPVVPVTPVDTPDLHKQPVRFSDLVISATHPPSMYITVDDRWFTNLPYALRETAKAAVAARNDGDVDRMRAVLKGVESPEGTPELLLGLSYLIHANPASINTAEKFYRIALQKGQPQAPALLGVLLTAGYIGTTGSPAEGRALIESVMANDRLAWLATSDSYLNGEGGSLDPVKAVSWMVKAAEAGEPYALLQYARLAAEGIGMERNPSLAEGALRRAADLGFSEAELTLANWMMNAYEKKFIDDPAEAVKLEERLAAKHWISAIAALGTFYTFTGRGPLWKDESRGTKLLQECSAFRDLRCHSNLGLALQDGRGVRQDLVTAWAHYDIGRRLSSDRVVMPGLAQIDKIMTPREKDNAHKLSQEIWAGLKDEPPLITLRREP